MKNLFLLCIVTLITATLVFSNKSGARDFISPSILNTKEELQRLYTLEKSTSKHTKKALNQLLNSEQIEFQRKYNAIRIVEIAARESTKHEEQFKGDAAAARAHALMWHITRNPAHKKKSAEIIKAWASTFKDFKVVKGYKPQMFLESAWILPIWISSLDMIKSDLTDWTSKDERQFRTFVKQLHKYAREAHRDNNWGTSAMLAEMSVAVYFEDERLYTEQLEKFTYYLKTLSNEDGSLNADYLSDPWHPQYTMIGLIQTAEIAANQGDNLFDIVIGDEKTPRLETILIHFKSLFLGELKNPKGLKRGNYKGAHNNKQSYQIALSHYEQSVNSKAWTESFRENWNPSETSQLFMMWDRVTHSQEIIKSVGSQRKD